MKLEAFSKHETTVEKGGIFTRQDRMYIHMYICDAEATYSVGSGSRSLIRWSISEWIGTPHRFLHVSSLLDICFGLSGPSPNMPLVRRLAAARFLRQKACRSASDQDLSARTASHICSRLRTRLKLQSVLRKRLVIFLLRNREQRHVSMRTGALPSEIVRVYHVLSIEFHIRRLHSHIFTVGMFFRASIQHRESCFTDDASHSTNLTEMFAAESSSEPTLQVRVVVSVGDSGSNVSIR